MPSLDWRRRPWTFSTTCAMRYHGDRSPAPRTTEHTPRSGPVADRLGFTADHSARYRESDVKANAYHEQRKNLPVTLRHSFLASDRARTADGQRRHLCLVGSPHDSSAHSTALLQRPTRSPGRSALARPLPTLQTPTRSPETGKGPSTSPDDTSARSALRQQASCHSCPQTATPWDRQSLRPEADELFRSFPTGGPKATRIAGSLHPGGQHNRRISAGQRVLPRGLSGTSGNTGAGSGAPS